MILSLYRHRGYIWRNALGEVRHRYAGSSMGLAWNVLQPLALILMFSIVFGQIMTGRGQFLGDMAGGYTVYLCSALLPWMAFSECVVRGTTTLVSHASFLRKLPLPEPVFVAQTTVAATIGLVISFGLLLVLSVWVGKGATWHWLLLPLPLGCLMALAFGVSVALSVIQPFLRDVVQVVQIVMRVGFWAYPIVWREDMVPTWWARLVQANPVYPSLTAVRELYLWGRLPGWEIWAAMAGWVVVAGLAGLIVLRMLRNELRDLL